MQPDIVLGLFKYYVSQKLGVPDPPSPSCQPKIRNWPTLQGYRKRIYALKKLSDKLSSVVS